MLKLYYKFNFAIEPKGVYKGRPVLYSPNAKDPQKRLVYHHVVEMLEQGISISKIAKSVRITRQTVYRIKNEYSNGK